MALNWEARTFPSNIFPKVRCPGFPSIRILDFASSVLILLDFRLVFAYPIRRPTFLFLLFDLRIERLQRCMRFNPIPVFVFSVVRCNKLKDTEWISRKDRYVCVEHGSNRYRTRTCTDGGKNPDLDYRIAIDGGKNPTFQEKFVYTPIEGLRELNVNVWNRRIAIPMTLLVAESGSDCQRHFHKDLMMALGHRSPNRQA